MQIRGGRNMNADNGAGKVFSGALWMFAMRWLTRMLGFISITILARLLDKDDFGLVAIASAVVALPMALTNFGVEAALVRDPHADRHSYNTAWTVRLLQMSVIGILLVASAPLVASVYGEPRLVDIVRVLGFLVIVQGFENSWVVSFRKELKFHKDFAYHTISRLLGTIVTLIAAFLLRSYWALVIGQFALVVARLVVGTAMARRIPVPSLARWDDLWGYSKWSLVAGLANYVRHNADRLLLGRFVGIGTVGAYSVGRELAELPVAELSMPANRALAPALANIKEDGPRFSGALVRSLGGVLTLAMPMGVGLFLIAADLIPILLGPGWETAIPVVEVLGLSSMLSASRGIVGNALSIQGYVKQIAVIHWVAAFLLLGFALLLIPAAGATGMALAFFLAELAAIVLVVSLAMRRLEALRLKDLGSAVLRPSVAVIGMFAWVSYISSRLEHTIAGLLLIIFSAACLYTVLILTTWIRMGMPDGIESVVLRFARDRIGRRSG